MKIIIVGCGKIGKSLAEKLVAEGHDVAVIDKSPEVIEEVTNAYDVIGLCGIGTDCEVLAEAGAARADIVIATTDSDELNMLSCYIARTLGAQYTIARIRDPEYNDKSLGFMVTQLQLSVALNPEASAAHTIANILKFPSAVNIETFASRRFEIVEMILDNDSPLIGKNMIDLRKHSPGKFLICSVLRENEVIIPDGRFELRGGDRIALTAAPNEIGKLLRSFGLITRKAKNVMILGASRIAYYLSQSLIASGHSVTVIDKDAKRCEEFAESLPGVTVINGDGADQDMLNRNGPGLVITDLRIHITNNVLVDFVCQSILPIQFLHRLQCNTQKFLFFIIQ
jgi:trk system potassium uptake protein TrkA